MGILIMANKGHYQNSKAVDNVIHYITRTRANEKRNNSLISYGGKGVGNYLTPDEIIRQIHYVQKIYRIDARAGRRVYHEFFLIDDKEFDSMNRRIDFVEQFATECCFVYYNMGFQVVYAIHVEKNKKLHIHFCISTINYRTGRKWHSNFNELKTREMLFNSIMAKYMNVVQPVIMNG